MKKISILFASFLVAATAWAYDSSVPSQCEDVMMQGFYWNSYHVDTADYPTTIYGDTRWKTLYKQASEIGAYFDLIWLPPSAYASGVGYHPKQYSNQNSDWGSRADLEALIAEFCEEDALVRSIVTPRFVPSCTSEMLEACGALARKYQLPVQSHLSENLSEIAFVTSSAHLIFCSSVLPG